MAIKGTELSTRISGSSKRFTLLLCADLVKPLWSCQQRAALCLSLGADLQECRAPWTPGNTRESGGTQHLQYKPAHKPFPVSAICWLILLYKLHFLLIMRTSSLPLLNIPTPPRVRSLIHFTCLFLSWSTRTHLLSHEVTSPCTHRLSVPSRELTEVNPAGNTGWRG